MIYIRICFCIFMAYEDYELDSRQRGRKCAVVKICKIKHKPVIITPIKKQTFSVLKQMCSL